jgi:hypothetical protein
MRTCSLGRPAFLDRSLRFIAGVPANASASARDDARTADVSAFRVAATAVGRLVFAAVASGSAACHEGDAEAETR